MRFLVVAILIQFPCMSFALESTITFNGLVGGNGTPFASYVENGFTVTATQGAWRVGTASGNPVPSIFSASNIGQIEVVGHRFKYLSMKTNDGGISSGISTATYEVEGFWNNSSVLTGMGRISPQYQTNLSPDSSQFLDRLVITISRGSTSTYNIDNIALEVPEPVPALLLTPIVGLIVIHRRASKGTVSRQLGAN